MLRALLLSLMNPALAGMATAQNLVANPSFEDTAHCDLSGVYSLRKAAGWYSANTATPDLYDCDLSRQCGEPMDPDDAGGVVIQGFQEAFHGSRFAAAFQWYGPGVPADQDTRDYCMTKLLAPLQAGQAYAVSLWCSRAEGYRFAIDHIGVHLSSDSVFVNSPSVSGLYPQARLRSVTQEYLIEGEAWLRIADTLVAVGGEQWIVIGTFEASDAVNGIVGTPGSAMQYAYYYLDQVEVVPLEGWSGLAELSAWYAGDDRMGLHWLGGSGTANYSVWDGSGRLITTGRLGASHSREQVQLPAALSSGLYIVRIESEGVRYVARFIKGEGAD